MDISRLIPLFPRNKTARSALDHIERRKNGEEYAFDANEDSTRGRLHSEIEGLFEERERREKRIEHLEKIVDEQAARLEEVEEAADEYEPLLLESAAGDLTRRLPSDGPAGFEPAANSVVETYDEAIGKYTGFVQVHRNATATLIDDAKAINHASELISRSMEDISAGTTEQNGQLHELYREMESLSSSIQEVAMTTTEVAALSERMWDAGRRGTNSAYEAMRRIDSIESETDAAVESIETLEEEMKQIGEITDFIADLAEQTNLLALNASIEASRSQATGGGGGGFEAISTEIKKLSDRTQNATAKIGRRIQRLEAKTAEAVVAIEEANQRIEDHVESIEVFEESIRSLKTISEGMRQTNAGIQEIDNVLSQQAEIVQHVVALCDNVSAISDEMSVLSNEVMTATELQTGQIERMQTKTELITAHTDTVADEMATYDVSRVDHRWFVSPVAADLTDELDPRLSELFIPERDTIRTRSVSSDGQRPPQSEPHVEDSF